MSRSQKNIFQDGIKDYSINLLWINKKKDINQKNIYNAKSEEELTTKFLTPAIKWAKENPKQDFAEINIWYDSVFHDKQAILNTQEILAKEASKAGCNNIQLKDIRNIDIVAQNSFLFTEEVPIYFRIDFLKLIICLDSLQNEAKDAAIFSDLEVGNLRADGKRMSKAELFDKDSMTKLKDFGIIVNKTPSGGHKNQFIQIVNDDTAVLCMNHTINACLLEGTNILNTAIKLKESNVNSMSDLVMRATIYGISQYYMGKKTGTIEIKEDNKWTPYNFETHGYAPLVKCKGKDKILNFGVDSYR
ncbi:MAG: hypothetical protein LN590_03520 [Rickettsia endosymbiont of Glossina mortisans submortisans]|nr:hypothetical protein [Rickettsia endosymbiont of Glossina mortisans submortisans]